MKEDIQEIIQRFRIFEVLTPEQKVRLYTDLKTVNLRKNDFLYCQGEHANSIYLLMDGSIKLGKKAKDDRQAIKEILHSGSILGSSVLHGLKIRQDFAQCVTKKSTLLQLELHALKYLMRINHNFSLNIIRLLSKKLSSLENRMATLMIYDARGRIIEFIRKTADEQGHRVGYETLIRHSLTQQEIASITGTSRQTVTQVLNQLKSQNIIHFNRKTILVRDLAKLA